MMMFVNSVDEKKRYFAVLCEIKRRPFVDFINQMDVSN